MSAIAVLFVFGAIVTFCSVGAAIAYGQRQTEAAIRERDGRLNALSEIEQECDDELEPSNILKATR